MSENNRTPTGENVRGYAICTTPRVGSNYLVSILQSTGRLGNPTEFFNGRARRNSGMPDYPEDPQLQLGYVLREGLTANGVYGLKVFPYQFDLAIGTRWAEVLPNLRFIHLERDDLLGQAISMVRAQQTGEWVASDKPKGERHYDPNAIRSALRTAAQGQARWRFWFARTGIRPLRLQYERVTEDPQGAVDAVAALVDLPERPALKPEKIWVKVQRSEESEEWRARFLRECGGRSTF